MTEHTEFKDFITRDEVRNNRDKLYVFGDNLLGVGYGGQAKEMRGEWNTIGIPTKKSPSEFFSDNDYDEIVPLINIRFEVIWYYLRRYEYTIVIPQAGIGTGLADLSNKAPKIWAVVKENLEKLGWKNETI